MASRRRRRTDSDSQSHNAPESVNQERSVMREEKRNETIASSSSSLTSGNCRDRSLEFSAVIRSLMQSNKEKPSHISSSINSAPSPRNEFNTLAKKISRDLANVFSKLEKLTFLAKRKSIFDDKETEIDQLTSFIRHDIGLLNKQIGQLQELSRMQRLVSGHDKQVHNNSVLVTLQSKLANMTSDFQSVLHVRTETLQQQKNRRDTFSSSANVPQMPSSSSATRWLLLDESNQSDVSIDMNNVQGDKPHVQLQSLEDKFIQSRVETMKNIEQTVVELGSIYQQLAQMVQEQGEMVQRIDSNVEESHTNIELAHGEIVRYFQSISSNRWLMVKIFAVLVVFFVFFVIFIS